MEGCQMPDTVSHQTSAADLWLAAGAALLAAALITHGPPDPDLSVQMQHIADGHGRWALVHWMAAGALFLLSGAGFLAIATNPAIRRSPVLGSAWMVMALGALITISTAVSEATALSVAADSGDLATFTIWWGFASGMANGFLGLALAVALIAYFDLRGTDGRLPGWAAAAGSLFGILSATGWILGMHLGLSIGGPVWLVSSLLMCLWLVWFGIAARIPRSTVIPARDV
ncbi:hypothetical protein A7A09_013410 [Paracoccus methylarcula]|uniref:Uncharacterized protein n=2 Tax=Paracoccus methylarcula TaxID=72022 RepID=A0A422QVB8_9RHOB|nr:hypothetical protein A7A09_013410 [Paracoccus methylarcula]